jgi:hypothetical protein
VSDFIERMKKVVLELSFIIERVLFKKERDFIAGIQKIIIACPFLLRGLKDGRMPVKVKIRRKLCRPIYQLVTLRFRIETFKDEKPVALKFFEPFANNATYSFKKICSIGNDAERTSSMVIGGAVWGKMMAFKVKAIIFKSFLTDFFSR